ncbi:MAG: hypothetical protein ACP5NG_03585, partial [Conexivisphaera sp.]
MSLDPPSIGLGELLVASGNDVVAMAKIVGGLRYQSYYPITPAADESFTLEEYESLHGEGYDSEIVVLQTEDELAAVNSAIGAALAGARSATATSGPGFDLMVEGLGWAGMNEVPVVVTYYQRGGPSTGQPTRGAQSDLLSSVFASHGEYPRIVLASGDHEEAFYDAIDALNYAERYQMPVIHLVDKFLANTIATIQVPDISRIRIDRGKLTGEVSGEYKRFDMSSPISPRAFLGQAVMWYTGDEHDEAGHITEDSENRIRIYEKRMRKLELADSEIPEERRASYYGPEDADFLLLGWGFVRVNGGMAALGLELFAIAMAVKLVLGSQLARLIRVDGIRNFFAISHEGGVDGAIMLTALQLGLVGGATYSPTMLAILLMSIVAPIGYGGRSALARHRPTSSLEFVRYELEDSTAEELSRTLPTAYVRWRATLREALGSAQELD